MRYLLMLGLAFTLSACSGANKKSKEMKDDKAKAEKSMDKSKKKASAAKASGDGVMCKGFGVTRQIAVMKTSTGCTVQYTKDGVMTEIANGSAASEHCDNVASKVRTNLEEKGFTCQ